MNLTAPGNYPFGHAATSFAEIKTDSLLPCNIFSRHGAHELESEGWTVEEDTLSAPSGGRPDLEISKGERPYRLVPVFATINPSNILNNARKRLAAADEPELELRILVVPDQPSSPTIDEHPRTVKLEDLPAACHTLS